MDTLVVGNIELDYVRPNIIRIRWTGELGPEEVDAMRDYGEQVRRELGEDPLVCGLFNVEEATGFRKDARKSILELSREQQGFKTAIVGASFEVRVLMEFVFTAMRLLIKGAPECRFYDHEEEALAWLEAELAAARS